MDVWDDKLAKEREDPESYRVPFPNAYNILPVLRYIFQVPMYNMLYKIMYYLYQGE